MTRSSTRITRREQLGLTLAAAGSFVLPGCGEDQTPNQPAPPLAVIIGSGFGGAVAALRLGQAGVKTIVLERGKRWPIPATYDGFSPSFPPDKRSTWLRTETALPLGPVTKIERYVGVLERVDTDTMNVYAGAAVGGGSIVYGGMTVQPTKEHFESIFPKEIDYDELDKTYYPRVRAMLGAAPIPADIVSTDYYEFGRLAEQQAAAAGLTSQRIDQAADWDIIRKEIAGTIKPSAIVGDLIYGANSGWKNSVDHNYLPQAEATGNVTIQPLSQVREIAAAQDNKYTVTFDTIDEQGHTVSTSTLTCDYLFLAAGSMGTSRLLVRAKAKGALPNLDASVGQGWGSNGDGMFMRSHLAEATGKKQAGPPFTSIVDYSNPVTPVFAECADYPSGLECHCLLSLGMGLDTKRGAFEYDAASDDAVLKWPDDGNDRAAQAIGDLVTRLDAAAGGSLEMDQLAGVTKNFTYHPLGGAVLGATCDFYGRVKNYARLYVIDGSMLPGSTACANPSLTIAAIAERNIERILAEDFGA